jgi:hypothetical protein
VAGPVLQNVGTALPVVQKIVELLRGRGVSGATIELPDGTKISVDNASAADIEHILEAAKKADAGRRSQGIPRAYMTPPRTARGTESGAAGRPPPRGT